MRTGETKHRLRRDAQAGRHLDLFLVSAVCAVLLIRFYLHLAGYPTIGGSRLHIAHMLWGGLLMLAALLVQLIYIGPGSRRQAAFIGGVGFGTFIDEVGKFLTHDNDYFFRPSVAIIYVVFVLIYLATRPLLRSGFGGNGAAAEVPPEPLGDGPPGRIMGWRRELFAGYRRIAVRPGFARSLKLFFTLQLVVKVGYFTVTVLGRSGPGGILHRLQNPWSMTPEGPAYLDSLLLGASLLQAVFVGLGLARLRDSRLAGFRMFQRSIMVSILFSQAFLFYRDQWLALVGLVFNVLVFAALRFMIAHEKT